MSRFASGAAAFVLYPVANRAKARGGGQVGGVIVEFGHLGAVEVGGPPAGLAAQQALHGPRQSRHDDELHPQLLPQAQEFGHVKTGVGAHHAQPHVRGQVGPKNEEEPDDVVRATAIAGA